MPIETNVQYIDDLDPTNPPATDPLSQVDDHLKLIKTAVKQSFPNITGAMTATHTVLNGMDSRVTALESGDATAIKNNAGAPQLTSGITSGEVRDVIGVGTAQSPQFAGISLGSDWSIEISGTSLYFSYAGANKVRIESNGNITSVDNLTAFGTI